jgi:ubiquinone/menaquinone biosynthesis C-methylase UbiE
VYSYHALEHFDDPLKALKEMKRVLKEGGGYWIGAPNRDRLIGYVGSESATIGQKIRWNVSDWKARLAGKFRNELGAHAGFTSRELESLLRDVFVEVKNVSDAYYMRIYHRRKILVSLLRVPLLSRFVYPSVYFMGSA